MLPGHDGVKMGGFGDYMQAMVGSGVSLTTTLRRRGRGQAAGHRRGGGGAASGLGVRYFLTRSPSPSAHARATSESAFSCPGILSQPPFSMNSPLDQLLTSPNSLSFAS